MPHLVKEMGKRNQASCYFGGDSPIAWISCKQASCALSTAEAELGFSLGESCVGLASELVSSLVRTSLLGDNVASVAILTLPSGSWSRGVLP